MSKPSVVTPGGLVLCAPAIGVHLAEQQDGPAWAILKPGRWRACTGTVEVTVEIMRQMAAAYDPAKLDRAAFNFDHAWGGPALGWVSRAFVERLDGEDYLWVVPTELAAELVEGLRAKRYERFSAELDPEYQPTGGWYLEGVAVLGAARPAVKGLPKPRLAQDRLVIHLSEDETPAPPAPPPTAPTPGQEPPMPDPNQQPPADGGAPANQPPAPPPAAPAAADGPALLAAVDAQRQQLAAATAAAEQATARARRVVAESEVDADLTRLGTRLTPAMCKQGIRQALVELKAAATPTTLKLTAAGAAGAPVEVERALYDVLLATLAAAPENPALGAGPLAADDDPTAPSARDQRTAEERAVHLRAGLTDERLAELEKKFGPAVH